MSYTNPEKAKIALRYWLLGKNYLLALKAMEYAESYHNGIRKNGQPEFHHQVSIGLFARTLPAIIDIESLMTSIFLHDIVEDKNIHPFTIEEKFGKKVSDTVKLLSKVILTEKVKNMQIYFDEIAKCPSASIIKGCDRIHNCQTMSGAFSTEKQINYIQETKEYIIPMLKTARRLFPEQESSYENIKHVLYTQIDLITKTIDKDKNDTK